MKNKKAPSRTQTWSLASNKQTFSLKIFEAAPCSEIFFQTRFPPKNFLPSLDIPWLSEKRAVCSWWKMYLGYLQSAQYAADEKCTLVICDARSMQLMKYIYLGYLQSARLMKNVPWLSEKRAVRSWWKVYLGCLRRAQYAADEKCTLVIWEARSKQLMEIVPWLSEKRTVRSWWKMYLGHLRSA